MTPRIRARIRLHRRLTEAIASESLFGDLTARDVAVVLAFLARHFAGLTRSEAPGRRQAAQGPQEVDQ